LTANTDGAVRAADTKTAQALNATDPDLSRFAAHGGKLILYHGWNDPAISPLNTIQYYEQVQAKMGDEKTADFVRLYMVPGMGHCAGWFDHSKRAGIRRFRCARKMGRAGHCAGLDHRNQIRRCKESGDDAADMPLSSGCEIQRQRRPE
jgi:hypothetical protein